MTRITKADLNGYDIPNVPAVLPTSKAKPPSITAAIRLALEGIYDHDEVFRDRINSYDNKTSQTGSYQFDKAFVAATIYKYATDNELKGLTTVEKPLGKIKHFLAGVLKEYGLDRQTRFRQAITDGRAAAARHVDEA